MKEAIAIINVPDDADIDELCITFDLERMINQDGDVETIWGGISEPLRPLPQKYKYYDLNEQPEEILANCCAEGWNDCLDAITGEKNDRYL